MVYAATDVTLSGRWANTGNGYTVLSCGSSFRFRFVGTSVAVTLVVPTRSYPTEIEWRVDSLSWQRSIISTEMSLAVGLDNGSHTCDVRLAGSAIDDGRWTNHYGLTLVSINANNVSQWPHDGKRFFVIGDSIAEGVITLGYEGDGHVNLPKYGTGRLAFPQLLADAHDASLIPFAFGSASVVQASLTPALDVAFPLSMSGLTQTDDPYDVVLIEGGNNDGSADSALFRTHYSNLIDLIKTHSPSAQIFCMEPLTVWDQSDARGVDIAYVSAQKGCSFIDTDTWNVDTPNLRHPGVTGHAQIAAYLETSVGAALDGLIATGLGDHINIGWSDTSTGEDGWYIERRRI